MLYYIYIMNNIINNIDEHDKLLEYLKNKTTNEEQKKFTLDFYIIFFNNNDFVVNYNIIKNWLIYSEKFAFKRFFQSFLIENEDYNIYTIKNREEFVFTIDAFRKMLIKYDNELKLHDYLIKLEKYVNEYYILYNKKLYDIEKNKILGDLEQIIDNKKSVIYIYNIDMTNKSKKPILKIGITENIQERVKTYNTSHPNGLIVYQEDIYKNSLKIAEKWLHHLLTEAGYLVKSECFQLSIDEAILWTRLINNDLKLTKKNDKITKLSEIVSKELYVIDNVICDNKILHYDISVQTDGIVEEINDTEEEIKPIKIYKEPPSNIGNFNKFIEECCIIDKEKEISSIDIIGAYRLWSRNINKDIYLNLLDYLKEVFKPVRMQIQDKNNVINGFRGVYLKEREEFKLPTNPSKFDLYIYNNCVFTPSGKTLFEDIKNNYINWQYKVYEYKTTENDIIELKKYLNDMKLIIKSNIWTNSNNGVGYYGINLNINIAFNKSITSSTSKKVEKINILTNEIMNTWNTIAKAGADEKISPCKMSRLCKNKVVIDDAYYYRVSL